MKFEISNFILLFLFSFGQADNKKQTTRIRVQTKYTSINEILKFHTPDSWFLKDV
jgi:hypothetical protein